MRIIQITDLHINQDPGPVRGVDTKKNFFVTLAESMKYAPDLLVVTGDLAYQSGNNEVYTWIKEQLENCGVREYRIIGGNHDDISMMVEVFGLANHVHGDELFYDLSPGLIFMDTVKACCSENQWRWLREKIDHIRDLRPVIFMHHPPFKAGVPHMDNKYAFQQSREFIDACKNASHSPVVFCGHYHNEISMETNGIRVFITPSTYFQINASKEEFEVDHYIPAFRIIDLNGNSLKTTVRYVFDK